VVIDVIPIVEIVEVNKVSEQEENGTSGSEYHIETKMPKDAHIVNSSAFQCRLQIITDPDGYNSGRKYVLQTGSPEACTTLLKELAALSKIERKKAERRSKFQQTQAKVKKLFFSNAFHVLMSFMILVVSDTSGFVVNLQVRM
jgi:hypothetical protein